MINWPFSFLLVAASFVVSFVAKRKAGRIGHAAASTILIFASIIYSLFFMSDKVLAMWYMPMFFWGCLVAEFPRTAEKIKGR